MTKQKARKSRGKSQTLIFPIELKSPAVLPSFCRIARSWPLAPPCLRRHFLDCFRQRFWPCLDNQSAKEIRSQGERNMKVIVLSLSLLVMVACSVHPTVNVKRDEFAQTTTVYLENVELLFNAYSHLTGGPTSLKLSFLRMIAPQYSPVQLVFASWSDDWVYLRCHDLYWLINDVSVRVETKRQPGSVRGRYVHEFITTEIPFETIENMVNARSVRGRLCTTEFKLSPEHLSALGQFVTSARRGPGS